MKQRAEDSEAGRAQVLLPSGSRNTAPGGEGGRETGPHTPHPHFMAPDGKGCHFTRSVQVKLLPQAEQVDQLAAWSRLYRDCLQAGIQAILGKDKEDKTSILTLARRAMPEAAAVLKDAACSESAANWKSYKGLWRNKKRGVPGLGDRARFCVRDRGVRVSGDTLMLGTRKDCLQIGYEAGYRQRELLKSAVKIGETEVFFRRGTWMASIAVRHVVERSFDGPESMVVLHTGQRYLLTALAVMPDGAFRFLWVPGFNWWGVKRKARSFRKALGEKKKLRKIKQSGKLEMRQAAWVSHHVSMGLTAWIETVCAGTTPAITVGRHVRMRSKFQKGRWKGDKEKNWRISNYSFAKLLDMVQFKLTRAGLPYRVVDEYKIGVTRVCSKCGGQNYLLAGHQVQCQSCGKKVWNEWTALRNLLGEDWRAKLQRKPSPFFDEKKVCEISRVEQRLRTRLQALAQKRLQ